MVVEHQDLIRVGNAGAFCLALSVGRCFGDSAEGFGLRSRLLRVRCQYICVGFGRHLLTSLGASALQHFVFHAFVDDCRLPLALTERVVGVAENLSRFKPFEICSQVFGPEEQSSRHPKSKRYPACSTSIHRCAQLSVPASIKKVTIPESLCSSAQVQSGCSSLSLSVAAMRRTGETCPVTLSTAHLSHSLEH